MRERKIFIDIEDIPRYLNTNTTNFQKTKKYTFTTDEKAISFPGSINHS